VFEAYVMLAGYVTPRLVNSAVVISPEPVVEAGERVVAKELALVAHVIA